MTSRLVALTAITVAVAGCAGSSSPTEPSGSGGDITVLAASSLTDAFAAEGQAFEARTGTHVTTSYAGSQYLVAQVQQGAPADVIATADTTTMKNVDSMLVNPSQVFVRNRLVIVVPEGNPDGIETLADLQRPGLKVVLADPSVPAGSYAQAALDADQVTVDPVSLELDVRSVLTKVEIGEADAGIVYATDAASAADDVDAIPIRDAPVASYPIGALTGAGQPFVAFVTSPKGERILRDYGFLPP